MGHPIGGICIGSNMLLFCPYSGYVAMMRLLLIMKKMPKNGKHMSKVRWLKTITYSPTRFRVDTTDATASKNDGKRREGVGGQRHLLRSEGALSSESELHLKIL